MYDPAKIPDPPAPPSSLKGCPYPKRMTGGNPDIFTQEQPTPQQAREAIAAYYACVSFVDDNVGLILDALEKQGLADNTIVFIMGDHGFHLGDHGFWSKYSMLEATRRAPLWVRVPGAPANGQVCREFVEFVDFMPTLGELLGFDVPETSKALSFAPLLAKPDQPWKKAVFMVQSPDEQIVRNRAVQLHGIQERPGAGGALRRGERSLGDRQPRGRSRLRQTRRRWPRCSKPAGRPRCRPKCRMEHCSVRAADGAGLRPTELAVAEKARAGDCQSPAGGQPFLEGAGAARRALRARTVRRRSPTSL